MHALARAHENTCIQLYAADSHMHTNIYSCACTHAFLSTTLNNYIYHIIEIHSFMKKWQMKRMLHYAPFADHNDKMLLRY